MSATSQSLTVTFCVLQQRKLFLITKLKVFCCKMRLSVFSNKQNLKEKKSFFTARNLLLLYWIAFRQFSLFTS